MLLAPCLVRGGLKRRNQPFEEGNPHPVAVASADNEERDLDSCH